MVLSPYSHPPPTEGGATMPSVNDQMPLDHQARTPNHSSWWMAPLPMHIRVKMPSCFPWQDKQIGQKQPPSAPTMAKSLWWISFYWPDCADAALVDTKRLANLKATLQDIAIAFSGQQYVQHKWDKWAIAHLVRPLNYLEGGKYMLKELASHLDHAMAWPGYMASRLANILPSFSSCYQCVGVLGSTLMHTRAAST